ncbi:translocation/assembly module TamB domain-containing protein [Fulvivirgaceae bacterium BMA12]|uniref:Translocation/assembly module TamB domain-containing protein n=1 Tax=Agaribacillus aureus TaxID=3051825 RepID=A0ABT8L7F0_9BACT|nr:translocation/assembly module TamB domain-containing protein [Fulvivirgaceae bacterium BMA12]
MFAIISLFVAMVVIIQIPYVQTKIVHKTSKYLSEKTGFKSMISYVNIRWFDTILLEGVEILDTQDSLMIGVEEITVDFNLNSLLFSDAINLDEVNLQQAKVQLIRNSPDGYLNINLFIANLNKLGSSEKGKGGGKSKPFLVDNIQLQNSQFSLIEPKKDSIRQGFDFRHFVLNNINAGIGQFKIVADTIEMDVRGLTTVEPVNNFVIKDLSTFFRICNRSMTFDRLNLITENSQIKESVIFNYESIKQLNDFNNNVRINAHLTGSTIFSKELAVFAPYMNRFEEFYKISGKFSGLISSLSIRDLELSFGNDSKIDGNLNIDGLPDFQESFIDLNLKNSKITSKDLFPYVKGNAFQQITRLGDVKFNGEFLGFPYDFVANGTFQTQFGRFDSDINLKTDEAAKSSVYSGSLKTYNFDFGGLIGYSDIVQRISLNGNIKGSGLTLEKADFELNADISKLGFKYYDYKNITTDARLTKELFNGSLGINDPNLKFSGDVSVDFRNNKNLFKVNARLDTLFASAIGLANKESFISTTLDLDMQGNTIDELIGEASFSNTSLIYDNKSLDLDTLHVFSSKNDRFRKFNLDSKEFSVDADGEFTFTKIYRDISDLYYEYKLNFKNDPKELSDYYKRKRNKKPEKYTFNYEIILKDINPYFKLINQDGYVAQNSKIEGKFTHGYTSILSTYAQLDTIRYRQSLFLNNSFDLSASKIADSANVLAMAYLFSDKQVYQDFVNTDNIMMEAVWDKDKIDFSSSFSQTENNNHFELNGLLVFLEESIEIKLAPSSSRAIDKIWHIQDNNKITFHNNEIIVDSLKIKSEDQYLLLDGVVSDSLVKKLKLVVHNFKIENINPLLRKELQGTIDGFVEFQRLFASPKINSQLQVSTFKINNFLVGNLYGLAAWENKLDRARLDFEIERLGKKIVDLRGYVTPGHETQQLDLSANFDQAELGVIEPFLDEYITEIKGLGSGEFDITGTLDYPMLRGDGFLSDGQVKINYLNTKYSFDGDIFLDDNEIGVRNLKLTDDNGSASTFSGGLFHDGFKNFIVDFEGDLDAFKVLNTSAKHNSLYYGTAIVTGDIEILGSFSNLNIYAEATTNRGTRFFIPVNATDEVEQLDFIRFTKKKDSILLGDPDDEIESVNIQRLNLDFDLDITPDAYSEIIFDIKSGDIIRGRSNGKLKLQIDPKGEFNMFGNLEIEEGAYNFTLKNIINKEFVIAPKSKISWFGDPYGGVMDIRASYAQQAALSPLFDTTEVRQNPDLRRKYPASVVLDLKGDLLNPGINFDLDFTAYPFTLNNSVTRLKSRLDNDEQELSRQVFSLIMLRKFSPRGTFDLGAGQSVSSSVSELLSNQLSYWITQVDENLEIDVDLGNLDEDAFNTFQLRLSYSFLDGRLRVTRDGGFTDGDSNAGVNSIVGDWTLEYLLTPDGRLKAKMYNKNNFYSDNTADQRSSTTAGFSIQYTENFDKIREIWKKNRASKDQIDAGVGKESDQEESEPLPEESVGGDISKKTTNRSDNKLP